MKNQPTALTLKPLILRVGLFVSMFLFLSGLAGSWLISTQTLFFPFLFSIYGSAGKVLLFGMLAFLLQSRVTLQTLPVSPFERKQVAWLLSSVGALGLFFLLANGLKGFTGWQEAPVLTLVTHLALLTSGLLALIGSFGPRYLVLILRTCWKPALISLVLATIFYFAFESIFKLWPYLSSIILWAVTKMLAVTNPGAVVIPPLTIHLKEFSVTIGEYCSGIESLFLISVLYFLIGCLEWKRVKMVSYCAMYCPLIIGMFALNIVRVFGIIQAGVWLSPQIAAKLFHTYLGMILFLGYFLLFIKYVSPLILRPARKKDETI